MSFDHATEDYGAYFRQDCLFIYDREEHQQLMVLDEESITQCEELFAEFRKHQAARPKEHKIL